MPHPPHDHDIDVWSVEGRFQHVIYSPKGAIEGLLMETDGIPTQFVIDQHDLLSAEQISSLHVGQAVTIEGTDPGPSHKGEPAHSVYTFERLAAIDGKEPQPRSEGPANAAGRVTRFNYARHGVANGVVLDSGDFVHTTPAGLEGLGLKIGDKVKAEGVARPLATGVGRVIEAHKINGKTIEPPH